MSQNAYTYQMPQGDWAFFACGVIGDGYETELEACRAALVNVSDRLVSEQTAQDRLAEFVRRARECQAERDGNKWVSKRFHLIEDLAAEKGEPRKVSVEGEEA